MSNPLLRPNDPRFQKPSITDAQGQNRFAESAEGTQPSSDAANAATGAGSQYVSPASEQQPYQPRYEATQPGRAGMLISLASFGLAGLFIGGLHLIGVFPFGWIIPLIATVPSAAAWLLAHEDLKAIRLGAIDEARSQQTRFAYWLGVLALLGCLGVLATMIYRGLSFLPDLL
jgi:hypothetical protein